MEMIEIDPKLFVTCRLCLDNLGVYQIVPSVQQQIKFCYDIEVHPFDRLPQLICKSCESVLSKYSEIKNSYVNKQKTLKEKLELKAVTSSNAPEPNNKTDAPEPNPKTNSEQDPVSLSQQLISKEKDKEESNGKVICDASSIKSTETENSSGKKAQNKKQYKRIKRSLPDSWEIEYDKWYICKLCNKWCRTRCGVVKHINTHPSLLHKCRTYVNKSCSVKLKKIDNKPNLCNSEQIVVHNMDKFICSHDNFYYTLFKQKKMFDISNNGITSKEPINIPNNDGGSESSDSEVVFKQNKRKRIRLLSRSSNETVVLENNNKEKLSNLDTKATSTSQFNMIINDNECINLDDSSDSASCKSINNTDNNLKKNSSSDQIDYKIIQNIISVCYKKYVKRFESNLSNDTSKTCTKNIDSSIKYKALSFGRKIINNYGINCIGILRYLEYHNLEVVWIPRFFTHSNKKLDHVHVMIKSKSPEDNDASDRGWTVLQDLRNPVASNTINLCEVNCVENQTLKANSNTHPSTDVVYIKGKSEGKKDAAVSEQITLSSTSTNSDRDLSLKKLLNANPVQNPKQLRKKSIEKPAHSVSTNETVEDADDNILHMPIITSTVSLAPVGNDDVSKQDKINAGAKKPNSNIDSNYSNINGERGSLNECQMLDKFSQRIKVKPVTELMSNRALNTMNNENEQVSNTPINPSNGISLPYQNSSNIVYKNTVSVPQISNEINASQIPKPTEMLILSEKSMLAQKANMDQEFLVMDTVSLPNKETDSPFKYFQMLLKINRIILLEGNEIMPSNFHNLIKFKLVFQQEANIPVVLCLSLYCSKPPNSEARFCIKVRDTNHKDIDITRLSANWQWEILKVYGGVVVTKMLQNAQKVSHAIHDCTKTFVSLLNEINIQK